MKNQLTNTNRPIGIDLFAGAGGMSLGFEQAGFDVVSAVEIDPVHSAVHKYNFPNTVNIPLSVKGLSAAKIRIMSGIGDKEVDCVFGGAPCQGFSMIGKRILDDPRNNLVLEFVRIVKELNARTFVFENVKGLTQGKQKKFLLELVDAFNKAGYNVKLPWQVLNASNYGVPQNRHRFFLIGSRAGERLPTYPNKTTASAGSTNGASELPDSPSCFDALNDLPNAETFKRLETSDNVKTSTYKHPSKYAEEMRCLTNDCWHFGYVREWNSTFMTSSARTKHTNISRRRFKETVCGKVEPISRFYKLNENGVSNTLRAGTDGSRGAFTSPRPIHYKYDRCITVREMARLHGFPDWFRFHVTKWHGARQVGNAVPPPLARAVAERIAASMGYAGNRPNQVLSLGEHSLLEMTITQAALYFGVTPPLNRRNQKSGSIKRKQAEVEAERLNKQVANG